MPLLMRLLATVGGIIGILRLSQEEKVFQSLKLLVYGFFIMLVALPMVCCTYG